MDNKSKAAANETSPEFKRFQKSYLMGYLFAMAGDWLQGPYVYALYSSYGYEKAEIATLFVAGFGSSMLFGTFIGSWADKYGRKKMAFVYCALYIGSCCTKHFSSYWMLMLGRVLGGISTSLVYSVFDSWMVSEHIAKGFDADWMKDTFSKAMIVNSCVAIASGIIAEFATGMKSLTGMTLGGEPETAFHMGGYTAPFDVAIIALLLCCVAVSQWNENYGTISGALAATDGGAAAGFSKFMESVSKAVATIRQDQKIMLIGAVCSLFEGSMFTFVFMWTPVISALDFGEIPFGFLFATFMVCCMAGSSLFNLVSSKYQVVTIVTGMLVVAMWVLSFPVMGAPLEIVYFGFLVFEVCVGIYWPGMGTMKGMYVPNAQRSAIYNVFRVPLNLIVLFSLQVEMETSTVFIYITLMLATAGYLMTRLAKITNEEKAAEEPDLERCEEKGGLLATANDSDATV